MSLGLHHPVLVTNWRVILEYCCYFDKDNVTLWVCLFEFEIPLAIWHFIQEIDRDPISKLENNNIILVVAYLWKICEILCYNLFLFRFYLHQMWWKFVCQSRNIFCSWWGFEGKWIVSNCLLERLLAEIALSIKKTRLQTYC